MHEFQPATKRFAVYLRALSAILLFLFAAIGNAQVAGTATIQGSISDPTGAIIPGATVTIINVSTNVQKTAQRATPVEATPSRISISEPTRSPSLRLASRPTSRPATC